MKIRKAAPPAGPVDGRIHLIRGCRVMLDADLAALYRVRTKDLNKAVVRNRGRFPSDFMFRLTVREFESLRFQSGTSNRGGRRHLPYAFTEQGVAMLSGVLRSRRAVRVNVDLMRAFVRLRQALGANMDLARKVAELERKVDGNFRVVFRAIHEWIESPEPEPDHERRIGFHRS